MQCSRPCFITDEALPLPAARRDGGLFHTSHWNEVLRNMKKTAVALAALAALAVSSAAQAQSARPQSAPPRAWLQCRACHTTKASEPDKVGPNLNKVFGSKAGAHRPNFNYSPALKNSGIIWNDRTLDAWLTNPARTVPGNRMAFAGIPDPAQRRALIAWLRNETR